MLANPLTRRVLAPLLLAAGVVLPFSILAQQRQVAPANTQLVERLIKESQAEYPGNCPCPYSVMRNGRACGGRSAWSKPSGASPLCYPDDVTPAMLKEAREAQVHATEKR